FAELKLLLRQRASRYWWTAIQYEAGEQIGWHWRELARYGERLFGAKDEGLDAAWRLLARGDALARTVDGATPLPQPEEPAAMCRRYRLHDFLLAQARRSLDAAWAD